MTQSILRPEILNTVNQEPAATCASVWRSKSGAKFGTNFGTGFNGAVYSVAVDTSDNIYCVGAFTEYDGVACNRIVRLLPNGKIDTSFNYGTGFNHHVYDIAIDPNTGKVVVCGAFTVYKDGAVNKVIRIGDTGSRDITFNCTLSFLSDVRCVDINASNSYVICGGNTAAFRDDRYAMHLLDDSGALEQDMYASGPWGASVGDPGEYYQAHRCCFLTNQNICFCGYSRQAYPPVWWYGAVLLYNARGTSKRKEIEWEKGGGLSTGPLCVMPDPDLYGGFYVGGDLNRFFATPRHIARYNASGGEDDTFLPSLENDSNYVSALLFLNDKIYASSFGTWSFNKTDGSLIASGGGPGYPGLKLSKMTEQSFGRILVGSYNPVRMFPFKYYYNCLIRLWPDLTFDKTLSLRH